MIAVESGDRKTAQFSTYLAEVLGIPDNILRQRDCLSKACENMASTLGFRGIRGTTLPDTDYPVYRVHQPDQRDLMVLAFDRPGRSLIAFAVMSPPVSLDNLMAALRNNFGSEEVYGQKNQ